MWGKWGWQLSSFCASVSRRIMSPLYSSIPLTWAMNQYIFAFCWIKKNLHILALIVLFLCFYIFLCIVQVEFVYRLRRCLLSVSIRTASDWSKVCPGKPAEKLECVYSKAALFLSYSLCFCVQQWQNCSQYCLNDSVTLRFQWNVWNTWCSEFNGFIDWKSTKHTFDRLSQIVLMFVCSIDK